MTRGLDGSQLAAIEAQIVFPIFFVYLEFVSETLRLVTGRRNIDWGGHTWLGNAHIMGLADPMRESTEVKATAGQVILGGANTDLISLALGQTRRDKKGKIYLGFGDQTSALVTTPLNIFSGNFDSATLEEDGAKSKITLNYEHQLIGLSQANELRYTKACQEALFPGDLGFDWVPAAAKWSGFWGKPAQVKYIRRRTTGRK